MEGRNVVILYFISIVLLMAIAVDGEENDSTVFVATNEWQTLQEGQAIPAGLHVRINLTSGKKEAKLISPEERVDRHSLAVLPDEEANNTENPTEEKPPSKLEKMEEAMKGIPTDDFAYSEAELKAIKSKFKTYDTIKKEFEDINMNIQTDSEIMNGLFERLKSVKKLSSNETDAIFEDLQYLLHQVDNALDFIGKGGLETVIVPSLVNQTNTRLTVLSLRLLAAITQNNPKAQIATFEHNIGDHLTRILSNRKNDEEVTTAGIAAFGSLIRKFPLAQKELFNKSGLSVLIHLLDTDVSLKIKLKTFILISDLLFEFNDATKEIPTGESDPIHQSRLQQYKAVAFETQLNNTRFCGAIEEFFIRHRSDVLEDLDVADKTVHSLVVTEKLCHEAWSQSPMFRHTLLVIKNNFDSRLLEASEDDKEFLEHVTKQLTYLNTELYKHIMIKDEL